MTCSASRTFRAMSTIAPVTKDRFANQLLDVPIPLVGSRSLFWPNAHNRKSAQWPLLPLRQGSKRVALQKPVYLPPIFMEAYIAAALTKLCHRGSRRPLIDRREVVIASEVVVDG